MPAIFAQKARLPRAGAGHESRWAADVRLEIDAAGLIARVEEGAAPRPGDVRVARLLPGMTNLHSHAFQRAMAGLTEVASGGDDDFWSWREWMYRFMSRLAPEDVEAIAGQLYVENLKRGYTALVEFHYLHRDPEGRPYADPSEMAQRIVAAGRASGIGLTLAPVLYTYGGFGRAPLGPHQRRFATAVDDILGMLDRLAPHADGNLALAVAPHSLRAAEGAEIRALVNAVRVAGPVHIHAAEQTKEVEECLRLTGRRPVRHLLDTVGLDARWCLVHATHLDESEVRDLAASGAVAGLCPSTEADLGDGIFPFGAYAAAGGRWGIGGDSHVCRDPFDELRLVEQVQRLAHRRRNLASHRPGAAIADALWDAAVAGGAQASGRPVGALAPGHRADCVVPRLPDAAGDLYGDAAWLNQAVFGGGGVAVDAVMVGGRWVVEGGRHVEEAAIAARYRASLRRLLD